uniref:Ig-like domain-containing protein n=1 Tax=Naja naja TaxID=35670 RepID=A0A8C6XFD9_NAJNA
VFWAVFSDDHFLEETWLQKCLFFASVVTGQDAKVTQHPETVLVKAGENLTLKCTLTGANFPGGVRWYKGLDRNQPPIYSDKQGASNRGIRVIPGSNTDFSINIQNVQPEDAGTYYCVKFRAGVQERELASGKGTVVSVIGKCSQPIGSPLRLVMLSQPKFPHRTVVVENKFLEKTSAMFPLKYNLPQK